MFTQAYMAFGPLGNREISVPKAAEVLLKDERRNWGMGEAGDKSDYMLLFLVVSGCGALGSTK